MEALKITDLDKAVSAGKFEASGTTGVNSASAAPKRNRPSGAQRRKAAKAYNIFLTGRHSEKLERAREIIRNDPKLYNEKKAEKFKAKHFVDGVFKLQRKPKKNNARLSGAERRRIGKARALARGDPIVGKKAISKIYSDVGFGTRKKVVIRHPSAYKKVNVKQSVIIRDPSAYKKVNNITPSRTLENQRPALDFRSAYEIEPERNDLRSYLDSKEINNYQSRNENQNIYVPDPMYYPESFSGFNERNLVANSIQEIKLYNDMYLQMLREKNTMPDYTARYSVEKNYSNMHDLSYSRSYRGRSKSPVKADFRDDYRNSEDYSLSRMSSVGYGRDDADRGRRRSPHRGAPRTETITRADSGFYWDHERSYTNKHTSNDPPNRGSSRSTRSRDDNRKTSTNLKIAIVPVDYPRSLLKSGAADVIKMSLANEIRPEEISNFGPQFDGIYYEQGVLVVVCQNRETTNWLKNVVPKLRGVQQLKTIDPTAQSRLTLKAVMRASKLTASNKPGVLLDLLKSQNVGLETAHWRVENCVEKDGDVTLTMYINDNDLKALQKLDMRPCLGLGKANFNVFEA